WLGNRVNNRTCPLFHRVRYRFGLPGDRKSIISSLLSQERLSLRQLRPLGVCICADRHKLLVKSPCLFLVSQKFCCSCRAVKPVKAVGLFTERSFKLFQGLCRLVRFEKHLS